MDTLHPDLQTLAFLIGAWEGEGVGRYPTVDDFEYRERVTFEAPPGKAFIAYRQSTWRAGEHPESGLPLHTESGYLRPGKEGGAEMVVVQPTGITEVLHGPVGGQQVSLMSTNVSRTATAKEVNTVERNLEVEGDVLTYRLLMGAVGQTHQLHLEARLRRAT